MLSTSGWSRNLSLPTNIFPLKHMHTSHALSFKPQTVSVSRIKLSSITDCLKQSKFFKLQQNDQCGCSPRCYQIKLHLLASIYVSIWASASTVSTWRSASFRWVDTAHRRLPRGRPRPLILKRPWHGYILTTSDQQDIPGFFQLYKIKSTNNMLMQHGKFQV